MATASNKLISLRDAQGTTEQPLTAETTLTHDELVAITDAEIKEVKDFIFMIDVTKDLANAISLVFAYEGFDPNDVYRHIAKIKKDKSLNMTDIMHDLLFLLGLHHMKGNITTRNIKSMEVRAQNTAMGLISKYKIQLAIGKNKKTAVTLPRLGAAFPFPLSSIAAHIDKSFPGPFNSSTLPSCMKTSSFAAMVPSSLNCTMLFLAAYTSYGADMSLNITGKSYSLTSKADKQAAWMKQWAYTDAMYKSNVYDSSQRLEIIVKLGLNKESVFEQLRNCIEFGNVTVTMTAAEFVAELTPVATAPTGPV